MLINLERSDFRDNQDDGTSFFELILDAANVDVKLWDEINLVEIHLTGATVKTDTVLNEVVVES